MVVGGRELIDTLWNVNFYLLKFQVLLRLELIDTLWNVNKTEPKLVKKEELRINRYIMECKFKQLNAQGVQLSELIDTLWNVN